MCNKLKKYKVILICAAVVTFFILFNILGNSKTDTDDLSEQEHSNSSSLPADPRDHEDFESKWEGEVTALRYMTEDPSNIVLDKPKYFHVDKQNTQGDMNNFKHFIWLYGNDKCEVLNAGKYKDSDTKVYCTVDEVPESCYPDSYEVYEDQVLLKLVYSEE